jgi:general secretion pathway protein A
VNYYAFFHLIKEPFANSPDPDLFYYSVQHHDCLQKLEIALRLRRGLSVVIGPVGTGKSTMCRALLQVLDDDSGTISAHLILDPDFTSAHEFLASIITTFGIEDDCRSEWLMKEAIKNYLIHQGVDNGIIPVLIIDEGQKLPDFCIEILREFLNFETNQNKLLEIVIFAQEEFAQILKEKQNFSDRITSYHRLGPLSFNETREMIRYRIQCCREDGATDPEIFPLLPLLLIYLLTKGYPRKIVMLCSKVLLSMLAKEKKKATLPLVWNSAAETSIPRLSPPRKAMYGAAGLVLLACVLLFYNIGRDNVSVPSESVGQQVVEKEVPGVATSPVSGLEAGRPTVPTVEVSSSSAVVKDRDRSTDNTGASVSLPDELGYLTVQKGMSMSRMVTRVYGSFTDHNLRMVLRANPYLSDPARLKVETKIFFPRIPNSPTSKMTPFLVSVGEFSTLQLAYDFLISHLDSGAAMRILPMWGDRSGLSFLVILKEAFSEEPQAQLAFDRLEGGLRSNATIIRELDGIPL